MDRPVWTILGFLILFLPGQVRAQQSPEPELIAKFRQLRDTTTWLQIAALPLDFPAHHPQGMVKIGRAFFMTSVEVLDRPAGQGVGHLFKFDENGKLLADIKLGEGPIYHPGGVDFDGKFLWVPVAEYRPKSRSIVYRVRPETLAVEEVFRFDDHLGGIVRDTDAQTLHAISWGSRTFYDWKLNNRGFIEKKDSEPYSTPNPSHYIDYQDCHYAGSNYMLCGGLKNYKSGDVIFRIGGLELVDLANYQPSHQIPLTLKAPSGRTMTQNPFWLEPTPTGLRAWFVPDDDSATLFVYEVILGS